MTDHHHLSESQHVSLHTRISAAIEEEESHAGVLRQLFTRSTQNDYISDRVQQCSLHEGVYSNEKDELPGVTECEE